MYKFNFRKMTGFGFLILFGLSCMLFPCEGKTLYSHFLLLYIFMHSCSLYSSDIKNIQKLKYLRMAKLLQIMI